MWENSRNSLNSGPILGRISRWPAGARGRAAERAIVGVWKVAGVVFKVAAIILNAIRAILVDYF